MEIAITGGELTEIETSAGLRFPGGNLAGLISASIPYIFFAAGAVLLFSIVLGGYTWMTSQGNPKQIEKGRSMLINAAIGFVVVFTAFWIVQILARILGLEPIIEVFG